MLDSSKNENYIHKTYKLVKPTNEKKHVELNNHIRKKMDVFWTSKKRLNCLRRRISGESRISCHWG